VDIEKELVELLRKKRVNREQIKQKEEMIEIVREMVRVFIQKAEAKKKIGRFGPYR
jgi:hypothetical protein